MNLLSSALEYFLIHLIFNFCPFSFEFCLFGSFVDLSRFWLWKDFIFLFVFEFNELRLFFRLFLVLGYIVNGAVQWDEIDICLLALLIATVMDVSFQYIFGLLQSSKIDQNFRVILIFVQLRGIFYDIFV